MFKLRPTLLVTPIILFAISLSCTKETLDHNSAEQHDNVALLSINQATELASLFSGALSGPFGEQTKSSATDTISRRLDNIDVFIDNNGDTLMYALNYSNNNGYILVGANVHGSPILAHAEQGNLYFDVLDDRNAVTLFINSYANNIKDRKISNTLDQEFYDNWKDIGKDGYEYEIEICPVDFFAQTKRKTSSSGKAAIYPYTGIDLDNWSQSGGYNYYAENGALIGCPAIAIGMLLYDTAQRINGTNTLTNPLFDSYDLSDVSSLQGPSAVAYKLRQIADAIPNYSWGEYPNGESGASGENIILGLRNLGYTSAAMIGYDFETLYNHLSHTQKDYLGNNTSYIRGTLLLGSSSFGAGHIWFCDGYYEQAYTVTKKFLGIVVKKWTEYDDRLYMNWGWGHNRGNGWYCATDTGEYWSSLDQGNVNYKRSPQMIINTWSYEMRPLE